MQFSKHLKKKKKNNTHVHNEWLSKIELFIKNVVSTYQTYFVISQQQVARINDNKEFYFSIRHIPVSNYYFRVKENAITIVAYVNQLFKIWLNENITGISSNITFSVPNKNLYIF